MDYFDPQRLEWAARAIAASKRGCGEMDPILDDVWQSYIGQARACIAAYNRQIVSKVELSNYTTGTRVEGAA